MNLFKRSILLAVIGFSILSAAFTTQAQFFGGTYGSPAVYPYAKTNYNTTNSVITGAWTNTYTLPPGTTTNASFPLIQLFNNKNVTVTLSASGTTNSAVVTLGLVRSADGVLWDSTPILLSATCPAGAATTVSTNIDIGAYGFLTGYSWTNTGGLSNAIVRIGLKPGF